MGTSSDHLGEVRYDDISSSVPGLVNQLQTEIHSLSTRNKEIRRRIQNIRNVVRRMYALPALRTIAGDSDHHCEPRSQRTPRRANNRLLRACRIALLEAPTPSSLEEIYDRIVRRGSFSFPNQLRDRPTLLRALRVMAEAREVRLLDKNLPVRWERVTAPEFDANDQQPSPEIRLCSSGQDRTPPTQYVGTSS
jgi:hypothetical protein